MLPWLCYDKGIKRALDVILLDPSTTYDAFSVQVLYSPAALEVLNREERQHLLHTWTDCFLYR